MGESIRIDTSGAAGWYPPDGRSQRAGEQHDDDEAGFWLMTSH